MKLRPYQKDSKSDIYSRWAQGDKNVLEVLPTGAGKTVLLSDIVHDNKGATCVIAHRQELVSQISLALAHNGVRHRIVAPPATVRWIVGLHMRGVGRSWYEPSSRVAVAGVNTILRRTGELGDWLRSVTLWVIDEAHHVTKDNQWGKAAALFPNARGLGVTATPLRADGKGLGRHADGVFDSMVVGPGMRDLIASGYLTDYRIFAPPSDLDLSSVKTSAATGDYSAPGLRNAVEKSHITGDVVAHYLRIAPGKLGVTFATDVASATEIAEKFNAAGVPAAVVSAKTPDKERVSILRRFKNRELLQLVNVDLFGEGFDLPAIEVVSMARPTQSYALFVQQFGRALRLMDGKDWAIIIDHVGNVVRHGLPDAPKSWSLDRREKRRSSAPTDVMPVKACPKCTGVFERIHKVCPFCGHYAEPVERSGPEFVDGDLCELDAATLATMREAVEAVDREPEAVRAAAAAKRMPVIGQLAHVKRHMVRKEAQAELRAEIALWAGVQRSKGREDSESYRRFYHTFGVDVLGAQALGTVEAAALADQLRIKNSGFSVNEA